MNLATQSTPSSSRNGLNIVIAAVAASPKLCGIARHAANLARCLLLREDVAQVHLLIGPWQHDALQTLLSPVDTRLHLHCVELGHGNLARNYWYYKHLPRMAEILEADIVHLAYPSLIKQSAFRCPTVVTLHDLYPYDIPANFGFPKVLFNKTILQRCLHTVDAIACVSNSTLRRLDMYAPWLAISKASVVYNCVDAGAAPSTTSPIPNWQGEPFLLCVAQHRRNKNIPLAVDVFQRLRESGDLTSNTSLLIVGIAGPETRSLQRQIARAGLRHHVLLLNGLTDADLEWCYAHCELLLAPSTIEGFGLPVVEAMFHQCRVLCSDIPTHREVGGSYPSYVSLGDNAKEGFAEAARAALQNHRFRTPSVERFAPTRIADSYMRLYAGLLLSRISQTRSPKRLNFPNPKEAPHELRS